MFNFLKKNKKEPKNLKEVLGVLKNLEERLKKTDKKLQILEKNSKFFLQKVGIIRFNPFPEVGSNQSFSIALLDNNNDGVVITSLYSREGNRVYGKPIKNGISEYSLSKEEIKAIEKAKNQDDKKNSKKHNKSASSSSGSGAH
jgi:hypothetical protein